MTRTAVITGGSQGLGRALAAVLVERGWRVVTDGRHADRLAGAAAALGPSLVAVAGDITDADHRGALAVAAGDRVDLVVNNASTLGASPLQAVTDLDLGALRRTFEVNVVAPVALLQALGARLGPGATVVDISSDAAVEAYPTWGGYGASKAALDHLGRVLAEERPDLPVLTVDPGDLRTQLHQDAFPGEDISDRPAPETVAPALADLIDGTRPGGRYRLTDLNGATPTGPTP